MKGGENIFPRACLFVTFSPIQIIFLKLTKIPAYRLLLFDCLPNIAL